VREGLWLCVGGRYRMRVVGRATVAALIVLLLSFHLNPIAAVQFYVEVGEERCISEDAKAGELLVVEYTIRPAESPCSVDIIDSGGQQIYVKDAGSGSTEEKQRFAATARRSGEHRLCFVSASGHQVAVEVQVRVGGRETDARAPGSQMAQKETLKPMEAKLQQLEQHVQTIVTDMKDSAQRQADMKILQDSTSTRMLTFSVLSLTLLLSLKAAEVLYLRAYFKSRRLIQ